MTNKKRPSVNMVAGRVKRISKGLMRESRKASSNATIIAVTKSEISMPGRMYANKKAFTAITNILIIKFTAVK